MFKEANILTRSSYLIATTSNVYSCDRRKYELTDVFEPVPQRTWMDEPWTVGNASGEVEMTCDDWPDGISNRIGDKLNVSLKTGACAQFYQFDQRLHETGNWRI